MDQNTNISIDFETKEQAIHWFLEMEDNQIILPYANKHIDSELGEFVKERWKLVIPNFTKDLNEILAMKDATLFADEKQEQTEDTNSYINKEFERKFIDAFLINIYKELYKLKIFDDELMLKKPIDSILEDFQQFDYGYAIFPPGLQERILYNSKAESYPPLQHNQSTPVNEFAKVGNVILYENSMLPDDMDTLLFFKNPLFALGDLELNPEYDEETDVITFKFWIWRNIKAEMKQYNFENNAIVSGGLFQPT